MTNKDKNSPFLTISLIYYLTPILILLIGIYFATSHTFSKIKILQTQEDIKYISTSIHNSFKGTYNSEITSIIILNDLLPFDIKTETTPLGYKIHNRLGGKIFFYEAFNTKKERDLYMNLRNKPDIYKKVSSGVSSYIVLFTNLSQKECMALSTINWRKITPNYIGMEASYLSPSKKYNGVYNLRNYVLIDNLNETYKSLDEGIISRRYLNKNQAQKACNCRLNSCTVALKFN